MTPNIQFKKGLCLAIALLVSFFVSVHSPSANIGEYRVSDISWAEDGGHFSVRISGTSGPTYTMYELFAPQRIVIDIAGGVIAPSLALPL